MKHANHLLAAAAMVAASIAMPAVATELSSGSEAVAPSTTQPTFHQWNVMAKAEASALAQKLGKDTGPWRVTAPNNNSEFANAFTKMLISELSAQGVKLTNNRKAVAVIELQADSMALKPDHKYVPGSLTLLTAGLWLVNGLADAMSPAGLATTMVVGTDLWLSHQKDTSKDPHTELSVNLVAADNGNVVASNTSLYLLVKKGLDSYYSNTSAPTLKFIK